MINRIYNMTRMGYCEFMEYKNLDNRILLWLVKERKEKGNDGRYRTSMLYKFYSDLPDEYISNDRWNSMGI
jgi:hypothetical protein